MSNYTSNVAYEPPESLWELIKENVKECELDVIKSTIGESLVDQSIELHNEVNTLLDIWRDYREETMLNLNQIIEINYTSKNFLPEPPDQRERLIKEINFFLKQIREKNDSKSFCSQLTARKHNLNVINYVLNTASTRFDDSESMDMILGDDTNRLTPKSVQRPISSMSKTTGLETPCMKTFRSQNNCSKMSTTLEIFEDKLNCMQIDEIVEHLREVLQEEIDTLLKDIDFLYECIDKESEYRLHSSKTVKEPTLSELKEERKRLEDDILISATTTTTTTTRTKSISSRPSSNNSVSSVTFSIKSPSPQPLINPKRQIESPSTLRTKLPLSLTSINKTGVNITNDLKLRTKPELTEINKPSSRINSHSNKESNNTFTLKTRTPAPLTATTKPLINRSTDNLASISPTPSTAPSSASSRTSSVSSLIRSKILVQPGVKQNSVEKFRKMVLESRDT